MSAPARVEAAGGLVHRRHHGRLQVLLVHRPARRDRPADWSWPKGKAEDAEPPPVTAVREVEEETGLRVRLGPGLGSLRYPLADGRRKRVRYWAATALDPAADPLVQPPEVDDTAWLDLDAAAALLTHAQDREPLRALRGHLAAAPTGTWPLVLLRHGKAHPRSEWDAPDDLRPLAHAGVAQAEVLRGLLACWAPERVLSSPWLRCTQSVQPFAAATGVPLEPVEAVSEEGHTRSPGAAAAAVAQLLEEGRPAVLCSHRPVLPTLLAVLAGRAAPAVAQQLPDVALRPGEALVAHVAGSGRPACVVATERHSV